MRQRNEACITSAALQAIALVIFVAAWVCIGLSIRAPEVTMGLGVFPSLAGHLLIPISAGVFLGGLAHAALASVRCYQMRQVV